MAIRGITRLRFATPPLKRWGNQAVCRGRREAVADEPQTYSQHWVSRMQTRPQTIRVLIVLLGAIVYANSLAGQFIFDDLESIVWNEHLHQLWPPSVPLSAPPQSPLAGRPVASLTFAINYALGNLRPAGYHAFNVAIHLGSALLLFEIARRTLALRGVTSPLTAGAIAALWMVHPLHTETLDYLTQRTELLVGFFFLLTLFFSLRSWTDAPRARTIAAAVTCSALGMCTKEVMVSAPLVVLLYDRTFVSGSFGASLRRHRALYLGLAASWLVLAAILLGSPRGDSVGFHHGISALDYLRTQAGAIAHYLRLAFWPRGLAISYRDWPIARTLGPVLPQGLLIVAILLTTCVAVVRRSWLGFLGAWFFLILAPSSSFVPIATEWVAERRMYLPLAAVVALVVLALRAVLVRLLPAGAEASTRGRAALDSASAATPAVSTSDHSGSFPALAFAGVLTLGAVFALSSFTVARNRQYASATALLEDNVRQRPANYEARALLGENLIDRARYEEAEKVLREVLRLKPDHAGAMNNLGLSLACRAQYEAAAEQFSAALREVPNPDVHVNLGNTLLSLSRPSEAVRHYEEAIALNPRSATAHKALGHFYYEQRNLRLAEAELAEAVRLSPDFPEAQLELGRVLMEAGALESGAKHIQISLRLRPTAEAHTWLAEIFEKQGRSAEAAAHFTAAAAMQAP
jgi:protein O-mannosyl-transferase